MVAIPFPSVALWFEYRRLPRNAQGRVMPTNTKTTPGTYPHISTTMTSIEAAIEEIESLPLGEQYSYVKIAAKHSVERTTLARRHQAKTLPRAVKGINQQ